MKKYAGILASIILSCSLLLMNGCRNKTSDSPLGTDQQVKGFGEADTMVSKDTTTLTEPMPKNKDLPGK